MNLRWIYWENCWFSTPKKDSLWNRHSVIHTCKTSMMNVKKSNTMVSFKLQLTKIPNIQLNNTERLFIVKSTKSATMIRRTLRTAMRCKFCLKMSWRDEKEKNKRFWENKKEDTMKYKNKKSDKGNVSGKDKESDKDKSSVEFRSNWQRALNSVQVQHQQSSQTHSPVTHTQTPEKNNLQSPNKTTTTIVHRSTTLQAMARVRARKRLLGWGIRKAGVFMERNMVAKKRNIWTGLTLLSIKMQGESDVSSHG